MLVFVYPTYSIGVFGFSYLEENADKVQGLSINQWRRTKLIGRVNRPIHLARAGKVGLAICSNGGIGVRLDKLRD